MKKGKILWAFIYIAVFIGSAVIGAPLLTKLTTGDGGTSNIRWDDTVGTVQTDFTYGDSEFHKFDLYLPADSTRDAYGLVVYIHGGGFTGGDKSGDADILKWATSKGICGGWYQLYAPYGRRPGYVPLQYVGGDTKRRGRGREKSERVRLSH